MKQFTSQLSHPMALTRFNMTGLISQPKINNRNSAFFGGICLYFKVSLSAKSLLLINNLVYVR